MKYISFDQHTCLTKGTQEAALLIIEDDLMNKLGENENVSATQKQLAFQ